MALKSLSEALAERLGSLSSKVPHHPDAFVNHLGILHHARIEDGHDALTAAVTGAAKELTMEGNTFVEQVLRHIAAEKSRTTAPADADIVVELPRAATG